MNSRIVCSPSTASQGDTVTVCYDTTGCALPLQLRVDFDPSALTDYFQQITDGQPCFELVIPDGCEGVVIVDESKQSTDGLITVLP